MAVAISLANLQNRVAYFQQGILTNLHYWQGWLETKQADVTALDRERHNIVRAISFAFDLDEAWILVYQLVTTFSPYMEHRGHWETWNRVLTQAIGTAQRKDDVNNIVTLSMLLARLLFQQSRFKDSVYTYRRTIQLARRNGDKFNEARCCTNLGYYYIEHGLWRRAEILCCHALKIFKTIDNAHGLAHTKNHLGYLYMWQFRWEHSEQHLKQACTIWQSMGDEHGLMRGFINLSALYINMEYLDEALEFAKKALHQAQLTGDKAVQGTIYMNIGFAYTLCEDFEKAESYSYQAETIFQQFLNLAGLAQVWGNLGFIYLRQEKWQDAMLHLKKALDTWQKLKNTKGEIRTLMDMVEYEVATGNLQQATTHLNKMEKLIEQHPDAVRYRNLESRLNKYRRILVGYSIR